MPEQTVDDHTEDEQLLAVLNSTPVVAGVPADHLADVAAARSWLDGTAGIGTEAELGHLRRVRSQLQAVVRGEQGPEVLAPELRGVARIPRVVEGGVDWTLQVPDDRTMAVRMVLAWDDLARRRPGRLRPCANPACRRFLLDRSKANAARWCSMAVCGNRMKARRHYQRTRSDAAG